MYLNITNSISYTEVHLNFIPASLSEFDPREGLVQKSLKPRRGWSGVSLLVSNAVSTWHTQGKNSLQWTVKKVISNAFELHLGGGYVCLGTNQQYKFGPTKLKILPKNTQKNMEHVDDWALVVDTGACVCQLRWTRCTLKRSGDCVSGTGGRVSGSGGGAATAAGLVAGGRS